MDYMTSCQACLQSLAGRQDVLSTDDLKLHGLGCLSLLRRMSGLESVDYLKLQIGMAGPKP